MQTAGDHAECCRGQLELVPQTGQEKAVVHARRSERDRHGEQSAEAQLPGDARWLLEELERRGGTSTDRLLAIFDACDTWMRREAARGCAFINAFAELPDPQHPARQVVTAQKQWMRDLFTRLASDIGARDPHELGERLFLLEEGATVAWAVQRC